MDKPVAIIGAGISGLRTAQLLTQAGRSAEIFEARDRVGGRMLTCRDPESGFYEGGGEWIDADQHRVITLANEFGNGMSPSDLYPGVVWHKERSCPEDQPFDEATDDMDRVYREAADLCAQLPADASQPNPLSHLDHVPLSSWLDDQCRTATGRWFAEAVTRSDEGEDTARVGLLGWLVGYRHYLDRSDGDMSAFRIKGGGGALCEKLAASLPCQIHLDSPVHDLSLDESGWTINVNGDKHGPYRQVVLTLPPSLLQTMPIHGLPAEYRFAWSATGMARAIKVALRFDHAFWDGTDWNGRLLTDKVCQQVWIAGQEGAPCLAAYVCGDQAVDLLHSGSAIQHVLEALCGFMPAAKDHFVSGQVHDWINDPWSKGAFCSLSPGSVATMPLLSKPYQGLHFVGDHACTWTGFIEGALESAERVAQEILG